MTTAKKTSYLKTKLPKEIQLEMKMWREGFECLPESYINLRKEQAMQALDLEVKENGWKVYDTKLVNDGWCDGMKFIQAIIELPTGDLKKIKFTDSQTWIQKADGGGWILFKNYEYAEAELV